LRKAKIMLCPYNSQSEVKLMTEMNVLKTKGGDGIMEEIVEIFI